MNACAHTQWQNGVFTLYPAVVVECPFCEREKMREEITRLSEIASCAERLAREKVELQEQVEVLKTILGERQGEEPAPAPAPPATYSIADLRNALFAARPSAVLTEILVKRIAEVGYNQTVAEVELAIEALERPRRPRPSDGGEGA